MVFQSIHAGAPDDKLLAYQYLQTLPKISEGASNKMWIIPSEFTEAMKGIGTAFAAGAGAAAGATGAAATGAGATGAAAGAGTDAASALAPAGGETPPQL